jgi:Tfp pilus assembly protein PilE
MRNKNQKGFGMVEVIVFGTLLSIIVMIYMSWSQILKRSINHMDQKINLDATDTIIERYLDFYFS